MAAPQVCPASNLCLFTCCVYYFAGGSGRKRKRTGSSPRKRSWEDQQAADREAASSGEVFCVFIMKPPWCVSMKLLVDHILILDIQHPQRKEIETQVLVGASTPT